MLGCRTIILHLSTDALDTSRIPALTKQGADLENPVLFVQNGAQSDSSWSQILPCSREALLEEMAPDQVTMIGGASTVLVFPRSEHVPFTIVHALHTLL